MQDATPDLRRLLRLEVEERATALVCSACSSDVSRARALLVADPDLARHDLACACVTGEADEVAKRLQQLPQLASTSVPPLGHEPILYACFSRFLRTEPDRAPGIRAVVRLLLDAGADLVQILLDAGASVPKAISERGVRPVTLIAELRLEPSG